MVAGGVFSSRPGRSAGMSPSGVCGRIPCKGTKPSPICSHRAGRGSSGKTEPCAARRIKWHGIAIDASQIPDLVPILAAAFSLAEGETVIHHAERLRLKESDRLAAMAEGLTAIGAQVEETPDGLILHGVPALAGGTAEGKNDHRVVMALAVTALRSDSPCTVNGRRKHPQKLP